MNISSETLDANRKMKRVRRELGVRNLNAKLSEYANAPCKGDKDGDVWDGRGHWWNDETKSEFLAWLRKQ